MTTPKTIRILSLDGGGIRGYISATFLKLLVQLWGINPAELWKYFDVITGTSVGGLQALCYAFGKTPAEMQALFLNQGSVIFNTWSIFFGGRAGWPTKSIVMPTGTPSSFYPNDGLVATIGNIFTTQTLQDMKTKVLITSYNKDTNVPVFFSNANLPGYIGQNELASNVALATASAPLYFPPATFGGVNYMDGGVQQNNPSELALTLGQMINQTANRFCVLSIGTGLGNIGTPPAVTRAQVERELALYHANNPQHHDLIEALKNTPNIFSNVQLLMSLIDIGITGCQEAVAFNLQNQSNYTLQNTYSYRFNYQLDLSRDIDLDNFDPAFMQYMADSTTQQFNNDLTNISAFLGHLTA